MQITLTLAGFGNRFARADWHYLLESNAIEMAARIDGADFFELFV
jgi:ABC-type glycerol-3-phosphate transport system permease component